MKECTSCRFALLDPYKEPCDSCYSYGNWKNKKRKSNWKVVGK